MSIADLGITGWKAFWANIMAPGAVGLYIVVLIVALLVGFAFRREASALMVGARVCAFMLAFVLLVGFLGVLGVNLQALTPALNWLLVQIQAPFYIPTH